MSSPLVSIIIPAFNREKLIGETLDSVLAQTFYDWEAIVVDDGSTDKTCEIVQQYIGKDKRIKLAIRDREPKGASVCRNIGLENAQGKYAVFLDSDDLIAPFCLEGRIGFMNAHPDFDFAVFQMTYFNEKGFLKNVVGLKKRDNYLYSYLRHDLPWNITCPFWKVSFIKNKLNGFNEAYPRLQDPEFNTRALMVEGVKYEVVFDWEADSYCRLHSAKLFSTTILMRGFKLYIEEFSKKIKKRADYEACRQQLKQCYIEAVRSFYSYYKPEWHNESIRILTDINSSAYNDGLIARKTYLLTGLLMSMYKSGLNKVSFMKYIFRSVMKLIKMS